MQYFTQATLTDIGVTLPTDNSDEFVEQLNQTLNDRVGAEIVESLDDSQLDEMLDLQESGTPDQLKSWLTSNVDDLDQIVEDERDILLGELLDESPALAAA